VQVDPHSGAFSYDLAGEFAAAMTAMAVGPSARIAVAVSGGADSMALALLLVQWARANGTSVHALTVDHGLRDAAPDEARQVERWLSPLKIPHTTLRWEEGRDYRSRPGSAQAAAREARYRLMTDWCVENDCGHLFLAHHADDQAETFLMRLARGSGVDGLAAMAPLSDRDGVRLARPLLSIPKSRLVAYCGQVGQPWIEDPSNTDETYGRVRFRAAREVLEREGLSADRLLATAEHMRRARAALDHYVADLLAKACAWDRHGLGRISLAAFLAAPEEVGLRALASVLMRVSGQVYRPRFERLTRLYESLCAGPWRDATLHGCLLVRDGDVLTVAREAAQISDEVHLRPGVTAIWDGRFEIVTTGGLPPREFRIRRLLQKEVPPAVRESPAWAEVPAYARETLPALVDSAGLAAIPSLNYVRTDLTTSPGVSVTAAIFCPGIDQFTGDDAEL
jgi:tRNA(Ile)-lysidine synthase